MLSITSETFESWENFVRLGPEFVLTIFTGGIIVGVVTGALSYILAHVWVVHLRQQRAKQRLARAYPHIVLKDPARSRHDSNLG